MKKIILSVLQIFIFGTLSVVLSANADEAGDQENLPEECKTLTKEQRKDPNGACYAMLKKEGGSRETEGVVEYVTLAKTNSSASFANAASPALTANTNYNLNRVPDWKDAGNTPAPTESSTTAPAADASTKKDGKQ
jgi:hypothetical protein